MSTPYVSGDISIANRWLNGSPTVLWIGDSIGAAFENRLFQVLRVTPAGYCARGGGYASLGSPAWATTGGGGLGVTGLLMENNYSLFATEEAVFNGSVVIEGGLPAAIDNRLMSDGGEVLLLGSRLGLTFAGGEWLAGTSLNLRAILYRNANSSNGIIRNYVRGSGSTSVAKGTGSFLNLPSTTPAYLVDNVPFTAPTGGEDLNLEAQSFGAAAPVNGSNFVLCCALVTTGQPGFTFVPASNGGWDVLKWLNPAVISDAALAGIMPLLGITDVVISIGQNNAGSQTAAQFQASLLALAARFRTAVPAVSIVFLPTYDTNNAGSGPHLASFADAHYAAQKQTSNSCFLNLYKAGGVWTQNNTLGLFTDGVHPNEVGKVFFLQTIQGLLDALIAGDRTTAAGRYATQTDVEDVFGRKTVAAWAEVDSFGGLDIPRTQRALDYADAAIDDYFRDGPYASPFLLGASQPTVANWAATIAGVRLYQSRTTNSSLATSTPLSASVSLSGSSSVSASLGQSTDPYVAMLGEARAEMARCKAGAFRLDATAGVPLGGTAPSLAV